MTIFYAKSTNSFFDSSVFDIAKMPSDKVSISFNEHADIMVQLNYPNNKILMGDENGQPITVNPPAPSAAQIAVAAGLELLATGIAITSISTSALDAVYSLSAQSQLDISAVDLYILRNSTFPRGLSTTLWADMAGDMHTFPSTAVFVAFGNAVADYVDQIEDYINSGGTEGSLPVSNAVTIA